MEKNNLVSVIIPTYNRASILSDSINSVLNQTYRNLELIIVDDGSTDDTKSVVDSISDPRVRYIKHDRNRGLSAARNSGIRGSKGEYIANNDSDDIWLADKLKTEMDVIQKSYQEVDVVFSRMKKTHRGGEEALVPGDDFELNNGNIHKEMLECNFITMQTALMKRECFEYVGGFDESLPALQDWDFWIRVSEKYKFSYIPNIGVIAKISEDSITKNQKARLYAREKILIKHEETFKKYKIIHAKLNYSVGHAYAIRGNRKKAIKYLYIATKKSINIKYLLAFFLALVCWGGAYRKLANLWGIRKKKS